MDVIPFCIQQGSGEPLILLHGNGEDHSYFCHQMGAFSAAYRVYALDTRGHGKTPRGDRPFTIRQFADDLLAFLDANAISKAHILGFSDGGNIAMVFALRHPERVQTLILNGANLHPRGVKRRTQLPIEMGYRIASLFAKRDPRAKANRELLGLMVNDPNIPAEALQTIAAPTLVIAGTKDMIRTAHTRLIADSIPNAKLVLLPGGHFIANRSPEPFNRAVLQFLEEEGGPCANGA